MTRATSATYRMGTIPPVLDVGSSSGATTPAPEVGLTASHRAAATLLV